MCAVAICGVIRRLLPLCTPTRAPHKHGPGSIHSHALSLSANPPICTAPSSPPRPATRRTHVVQSDRHSSLAACVHQWWGRKQILKSQFPSRFTT